MPIVVSDTSHLRALEFVDHLELLSQLFQEVIIPPAVADELREPARRFRAVDVARFPFLRVVVPQSLGEVNRLLSALDRGESEALVLAGELRADAVLIDEADGRRVALEMGLVPIGTLGILVRAKQEKLIVEVQPIMERLIHDLGFFISDELFDAVLEQAGEA